MAEINSTFLLQQATQGMLSLQAPTKVAASLSERTRSTNSEELTIAKSQLTQLRELSVQIQQLSSKMLSGEPFAAEEAALEVQKRALSIVCMVDETISRQNENSSQSNSDLMKKKKRKKAPVPVQAVCKLCGCTHEQTTQWRRGPDGYRSFCNKCGLRYASIMKKEEQLQHQQQQKASQIPVSMLVNTVEENEHMPPPSILHVLAPVTPCLP